MGRVFQGGKETTKQRYLVWRHSTCSGPQEVAGEDRAEMSKFYYA